MDSTWKSSAMEYPQSSQSYVSNPNDEHFCELEQNIYQHQGPTLSIISYCLNEMSEVNKKGSQDNKLNRKVLSNLKQTTLYLINQNKKNPFKYIAGNKRQEKEYKYDLIVHFEQQLGETCDNDLNNNCSAEVVKSIMIQFILGLKQYQSLGLYDLNRIAQNFRKTRNKHLVWKHVNNKFVLNFGKTNNKAVGRNKIILKEFQRLVGTKSQRFYSLLRDIQANYQQSIMDKKKLQQIHNMQLQQFARKVLSIMTPLMPKNPALRQLYQIMKNYNFSKSREYFLHQLQSFQAQSIFGEKKNFQDQQQFGCLQNKDKKRNQLSSSKTKYYQENKNKQQKPQDDFKLFQSFIKETKQLQRIITRNNQQLKKLYTQLRYKGLSNSLKQQIQNLGFSVPSQIRTLLATKIQQKFKALRSLMKNDQQMKKNLYDLQYFQMDIEEQFLVNAIILLTNKPLNYRNQLESLRKIKHHLQKQDQQTMVMIIKQIYENQACQVFRTFIKQLIIGHFQQLGKKKTNQVSKDNNNKTEVTKDKARQSKKQAKNQKTKSKANEDEQKSKKMKQNQSVSQSFKGVQGNITQNGGNMKINNIKGDQINNQNINILNVAPQYSSDDQEGEQSKSQSRQSSYQEQGEQSKQSDQQGSQQQRQDRQDRFSHQDSRFDNYDDYSE